MSCRTRGEIPSICPSIHLSVHPSIHPRGGLSQPPDSLSQPWGGGTYGRTDGISPRVLQDIVPYRVCCPKSDLGAQESDLGAQESYLGAQESDLGAQESDLKRLGGHGKTQWGL